MQSSKMAQRTYPVVNKTCRSAAPSACNNPAPNNTDKPAFTAGVDSVARRSQLHILAEEPVP
jgi:hypothetical protein